MTKLKTLLARVRACDEACVWAESYATFEDAWENCPRGDWMLWISGKMADKPGWPTRKQVVFACCQVARVALKHVPAAELRPLRCIETVEAWIRGEATIADVRKARDAAADAYAAYAAAYAAAADAYAYAAAAAAAAYAAAADAYAARSKSLAESAGLIRTIARDDSWFAKQTAEAAEPSK